MTTSIQRSSTLEILSESLSLKDEEVLCWNILKGNLNIVKESLDLGLHPDYRLKEKVIIDNVIFDKGSSLLFLVIHCSILGLNFENYFSFLQFLLERRVNIENSPGGGYTNVLDYACENANLIEENILILLLNSVALERTLVSLEKISDFVKRENLRKNLLKNNPNCQLNSETKINSLIEELILNILISGNENQFKELLDLGLDPDYTLSKDIVVKNCVFSYGLSLLLIVLKACVKWNASDQLFGIIALLLERGVNLNLKCCNISPLQYICENYDSLNKNIVLYLLTSVTTEEMICVLRNISNKEQRKELEKLLSSKTNKELLASSLEEDPLEGTSSDNVFNLRQTETKNRNDKKEFSDAKKLNSLPLVDFSEIKVTFCKFINISSNIDSILNFIINERNFEKLEEILKSKEKMKTLEKEIKIKNSYETCFSILFQNIGNSILRHVLCFLFIKHGFSLKDKVYEEASLFNFVCNFRNSSFFSESSNNKVLMQTIYLLFFLVDQEELSISFIQIFRNKQDQKKLSLFLNGKSQLNALEILRSRRIDYDLFKAYLEASILTNKDAITGEEWNINKLYKGKTLLFQVTHSLCASSLCVKTSDSYERQSFLFKIFSILLQFGADPDLAIFQNHRTISVNKMVLDFCKDSSIQKILVKELENNPKSQNNKSLTFSLKRKQIEQLGKESKKSKIDLIAIDKDDFKRFSLEDISIEKQFQNFYNSQSMAFLPLIDISRIKISFSNFINFSTKINKIMSIINENDWNRIEEILKSKEELKELDKEAKKINPEETLFSFLFKKVENSFFRHMLCFLFIKYGFSAESIVYRKINMVNFVCSYKLNSNSKILMQTIYFLFFLIKKEELIKIAIQNCSNKQEKSRLSFYFLLEKEKLSALEILKARHIDYDLFKAYLEASILTNKDAITEKEWNVDKLYEGKTLLFQITSSLCKSILDPKTLDSKDRRMYLLEMFLIFLNLGANPDLAISQNEETISVKDMIFGLHKDVRMKKILLKILEKNIQNKKQLIEEIEKTELIVESTVSQNDYIVESSLYVKNLLISKEILSQAYNIVKSINNKENFSLLLSFLQSCDFTKTLDVSTSYIIDKLLTSGIKDYLLHETCLLLLKHGLTGDTILFHKCSVAEYVITNRHVICNKETLLMFLLDLKDFTCIERFIEKAHNNSLKKSIEVCLKDPITGKLDLRRINFEEVIKNKDKIPLVKGFIQLSKLRGKNIVTNQVWDINRLCDKLGDLVLGIIAKVDKNYLVEKELYIYFFNFLVKNGLDISKCNWNILDKNTEKRIRKQL